MRVGVDDGSTVTDYLPEERARGITITAAAITFPWAKRTINLVDTPGHADFTFEVSRSLRVLDGAIAVLDAVAGVEAQTETVWRQADDWNISRIVFVNKMDREGAGFGRTVREIMSRLGANPVVLQLPVFENGLEGGSFLGVADLIEFKVLTSAIDPNGKCHVSAVNLNDWPDVAVIAEAKVARTAMLESLAELDDDFLEQYIELNGDLSLPSASIHKALRCLTIRRAIVPVLCGASLRGIGVQPLLDAVVNYLPSPADIPPPSVQLLSNDRRLPLPRVDPKCTCALAFKVIDDALLGQLVFVRVYQGSITRGMSLFNTRSRQRERANRLLQMYADDSIDLDCIAAGNIGVILGLKSAVTGDTIVSKGSSEEFNLQPIPSPPPVFIASIEPESPAEFSAVSAAVQRLLREDPSLSLSMDEDSGQILLSGMGELHLEIARDKLVKQFGAKCDMSKLRVSYRETIPVSAEGTVEKIYERDLRGKHTKVGIKVNVSSLTTSSIRESSTGTRRTFWEYGNLIDIDMSQTHALTSLDEGQAREAILSGVKAALQSGPTFQLPLHSAVVQISDVQGFDRMTTYQSLFTAARLATIEGIRDSTGPGGSTLMEPYMKLLVTIPEQELGPVISDLTSTRGGVVLSMNSSTATDAASDARQSLGSTYIPPNATADGRPSQALSLSLSMCCAISARVPLREMIGYAGSLRGMTQGRGSFVMSLEGFEKMTEDRAVRLRKELTGVDG
jgi:elongation factor G